MTQMGLADFKGNNINDANDVRLDEEAVAVTGDAGQHISGIVDTDEVRFPDPDRMVELAITRADYTIGGAGCGEYPVIHIFGRTADDEIGHVCVFRFRSYFYAPTDSPDDGDLGRDVITDTEDDYESIRGEEPTKIFDCISRGIGQIHDEFSHHEAGILFPNRLLIDKDTKGGVSIPEHRLDDGMIQTPHQEVAPAEVNTNLRVNAFDTETNDQNGFSEESEEPIICLISHDSYRNGCVVWHAVVNEGPGKRPDTLPDYDSPGENGDVEVRVFSEGVVMLDALLTYIGEIDPDILIGWNFEDFDASYFLDRSEEVDERIDLDLDYNRILRLGEAWHDGWGGPDIKGRVAFDLLYVYKRTQFTKFESYRLGAVSELELDAGKERCSGDIGDLWEESPERLLEHNLRDVELCVEIDREQDIIALWDEMRMSVSCKLEDASTPGNTVDIYVLHKVHGEFTLPSKGEQESEDHEDRVAFDPITGVKESITVFDLRSLCPMCMVATNAPSETKVDPECYDGEMLRAPNGTHSQQGPDGMIREMVDELPTEREERKLLRNFHGLGSSEYE